MLAEKKEKFTADEYLSMTDLEGRYELIDGEIYDMSPSPNVRHQDITGGIYSEIRNYIRKNGGKCRVLIAPSDVKLNDNNVVQPDIYVVCDPCKLDEHGCNGAPDWVMEVLSPFNARHDTEVKLSLYSGAGVREYWIIDPMNEKVYVHPFAETKTTGVYTFDDDILAGIYKNEPEPLIIRINDL